MKNNGLIILGVLSIFLILENLFPLRKRRDQSLRFFHNFFLTVLALPITKLLTLPLVLFVAYTAEVKGHGILNVLSLNPSLHFLLGFLILDYTLYWWHVANHRLRFFWRFHQVHHTDRDMDVTTALRFHFGELVLSAFMRCVLILIFGMQIETILIFDLVVTSATIFHHSNLKLPLWIEKILNLVIVTPLYHQNHHSYYQSETNSNFATIFNFWDRFHFSYTSSHRPEDITIGHPAFNDGKVQFLELIRMPFKVIRNWPQSWRKRILVCETKTKI